MLDEISALNDTEILWQEINRYLADCVDKIVYER